MKKFLFVWMALLILFLGGYISYKKYNPNSNTHKKFTFWTIQLKPIYEKEINEIIKNFELKHPDYKVIWVDIPIAEAQKRTLASILSDNPPDLVNLNPDFSVLLAQKNALYFFEDNELQNYIPSLVNKLRYEGKIYAIPFYATSSTTIYNKEIFEKCSQTVPKTYDELYEVAKTLKKCSNISPFATNLNENDTLAKILNKYNVSNLKDEAQTQNITYIYKMFDDMYKNNLLPKDILTINHREMIEKYMSNQALLIVAGSNFINMIKQNAPDIYKKSDIAPQLTGSNNSYDVALMNLIIPKKSKNIELAREFAFELTNNKNQMKLAKLTNVLPVNIQTLNDNYFKICSNDLVDKARCVSVKQLNNLNVVSFKEANKKIINEAINKTLEEILLNNKPIEKEVSNLIYTLKILQN